MRGTGGWMTYCLRRVFNPHSEVGKDGALRRPRAAQARNE
jgi:hypothetical protein